MERNGNLWTLNQIWENQIKNDSKKLRKIKKKRRKKSSKKEKKKNKDRKKTRQKIFTSIKQEATLETKKTKMN